MLQVKTKAASASPGVLPLVLAVTAGAAVVVAAAIAELVGTGLSAAEVAGLLALFAAAAFTEAFPLPIRSIPIGRTSLASVFVVGTIVVYGWAEGTLLSFLMQLTVEAGRRRPPVRIAYNSSVYALAASAGGAVAVAAGSHVLVQTTFAAAAFYTVDLALVALVVARTSHEHYGPLLRRTLAATLVPLAIMVSLSIVLVILWDRSPFLVAALFGPLVAFDLYQRSQLRALEAMRAALTDPVTGLGNRRRFDDRLSSEVPEMGRDTPLSVCLLDVDGLKGINDRYGHPTGDRALQAVAARLGGSGEAFRLGGDEFALLLPGVEADQARVLIELVLIDVAREAGLDTPVRVSGGVAAYPRDGTTPASLVQRADEALYESKRNTRGRVQTRTAGDAELGVFSIVPNTPADRATRLRTALGLARTVDARDALEGSHSESVGRLAAAVAVRLGCDRDECDLVELAGRLHDLGKVAIPDEILEKAGPLDPDERRVLERHPVLAANMLESLGLVNISGWVLHHHERWDGTGYPDQLAGEEIPLVARILAAVESYDAMVSDHVYREALPRERALAELQLCAGTQFDPQVVMALLAELEGQRS
ncbi:MAG TPA: diguanylate cyclase [Gaiellaceae bacterium]|nr:diguanylate cyclase [Gaiellaceae bacterium]